MALNAWISIVSVIGFVFFHSVLSRFAFRNGTVLLAVVSYLLSLLVFIFLVSRESVPAEFAPYSREFVFAHWYVFSCSTFLYFAFSNFGETSLRLRFLREVLSSNQGVSMKELEARYNLDHVVQVRLKRLESMGEIEKTGTQYRLVRFRMAFLARIFHSLKVLYGVR